MAEVAGYIDASYESTNVDRTKLSTLSFGKIVGYDAGGFNRTPFGIAISKCLVGPNTYYIAHDKIAQKLIIMPGEKKPNNLKTVALERKECGENILFTVNAEEMQNSIFNITAGLTGSMHASIID